MDVPGRSHDHAERRSGSRSHTLVIPADSQACEAFTNGLRRVRACTTRSCTGGGDVDDEPCLVGLEGFVGGELGVEQGGRHEVPGPPFRPSPEYLSHAVKVQEDGVRGLFPGWRRDSCGVAPSRRAPARRHRHGPERRRRWRARASSAHRSAGCRQPSWPRSPPGAANRRPGTGRRVRGQRGRRWWSCRSRRRPSPPHGACRWLGV
ncbi:hypothetical protein Achl_1718 [Pseudarthrobacter chlorophenolicus A6]|uniref:Uncharacterized protein n=1 Tax=Pseudarthrobacter chlorophenolicus (strain ATCC 700700 / DSM 12829 / CIP 107037 / JCM 12360 / KCTC 9906 / NCIMB 13794 / A6) TaxID=452863 RepID=B8H6Y0_PSECP|nr:hypothetical protein Achl_1718 [Pseudarthrobacter chlorophenolicus A6]SDQ95109.1 hypothetical protein SAMN04489738_3786 [Pseudarthrobacter chlorophenolicus]